MHEDMRAAEEPEALKLVPFPPVRCRLDSHFKDSLTLLTSTQLQSVALAVEALSRPPRAFFLGHGPGVGKTRILAAVVKQHLLVEKSPKVLWLVPNVLLAKQAESEAALFEIQGLCRICSYAQVKSDDVGGSLLILDEAHLIRNACALSDKINDLQDRYEAVLYSTATAASNVARLSYMKRLRLWGPSTPFPTFKDFSGAFKRWGPAAAEMLALDLKQQGLYTCFKLPLVPLQTLELAPDSSARRTFDEACTVWRTRPGADRHSFLQRLVTSLKARLLLPRWQRDLQEGYAVVVVCQGTGAAASPGSSMLAHVCRRNGLEEVDGLPLDALDLLREGLRPEGVAEVSGRPVRARQGAEVDAIKGNACELKAFQEGRRRVLAMSAAGTLGLNVVSPLPIRMYILELPWTPEALAQQLGRCNRLNSRPPQYFKVTLNTLVEMRVEAPLARRSETLGALSCADRSAGALTSLPWGSKLMQAVTLELAVRALGASLPATDVRRLVQNAAASQGLVGRMGRLARLRRQSFLRGDEAERLFTLESILEHDAIPHSWLIGAWTTQKHALFPQEERAVIRTAALALNRRRLPHVLLTGILEFAFGSDWAVTPLLQALPEREAILDETDFSSFLSSGCSLRLAEQRRLLQCFEENAARLAEQRPRIISVVEYCTGRKAAPKGYDFDMAVTGEAAEVFVTVKSLNLEVPVEQPLLFCTAHGHIFHQEGDSVRQPGRPERTTQGVPPRSWVPLDALWRFRGFEAKNLRLRERAALNMSKVLRLRVQEPMRHWEQSAQQVLSVPATASRARFVGLLMKAT
jgi:hypothetical protein